MGDRTYVTLNVRRQDEAEVRRIIGQANYDPESPDIDPEDTAFVQMGFEEVNYGELPFLDELEHAGIPYDSEWAKGDEYSEGTRYGRYTDDGEFVGVELYELDYALWIDDLMRNIHDYTELTTLIRQRHHGLQIISWESQEHNSKLFRTKQLITQ